MAKFSSGILTAAVFVTAFSAAEAVTRWLDGSGDCTSGCAINAKTSGSGIVCDNDPANCTTGSCIPRQNIVGSTKVRWCGCSNDLATCCTARDSWVWVGTEPPHWELDNVFCHTAGGVTCDAEEYCTVSMDNTCDCQEIF